MIYQADNRGRTWRVMVGVTGVIALASLSACSSGDTDTAASPSATVSIKVDEAAAALVPDKIKTAGKLQVGTDSTYAPVNFLDEDGKTVIGLDIDILDAVAAHLGLQTQYVSAPFDNLLPSIESGKFDMGASAFTINADRLKVVNMVSYFNAGTQWATATGNPAAVSPDDACGKVVGVQKGTVQVEDITARSKKCTDAGKKAIKIDQYQGQDQVTASVVSGKSDAMLADSPIIAFAITKSSGKLETLGELYDAAPYGWAVPKEQTDLAEALQKAAEAAKADGSYTAALKKWEATSGAVDAFVVNPKTS